MNLSRIALSLVLIVGAGGAIVNGTSAYFSDTETSTGNTFTAGSIDLRIDHTRQTYNDEICEDDCVEQTTNLVTNGSFEEPVVNTPQNWNVFDSVAGGWNVEWRSDIPETFGPQTRPSPAHLELHRGVLGAAAEGQQYAELDSDWGGPSSSATGEPASIMIYQDISTVIGRSYKLRFHWAARPNTVAAQNRIEVAWGGDVITTTGPLADPNAGITWIEVEIDLPAATTTTTRIAFTDRGTANSEGSFLDNVRLTEVICTPSLGMGGQCKLWSEKDLEEGDTFWNFSDVKPGDRGTNTISLHVYDNDAYACLMTTDVQDNENNQIDPEVAAGDDDGLEGLGNGELLEFLKLFIWDDGAAGNGTYEIGEDVLYGPNETFDNVDMTRLSLAATTTTHLGVAWCFGEQTVDGGTGAITCDGNDSQYNVAQTDSVLADLEFYAVQQRNNGDFQCSDLLPDNGPNPGPSLQ